MHTLSGGTTLITGGSGSFGRAFIRHVLADPEFDGRLVSMSRNAEMRYQLEQRQPEDVRVGRLVVVPGDVRQMSDLMALAPFQITTIIHAAAEKFVTTGQRFAAYTESVNEDGTANVLAFARAAGVKRLLALSTDKATDGVGGEPPANFYGLTKQRVERLLLEASRLPGPVTALTRYGNVVASAGSVLGLFKTQREKGRLTVTDLRCSRFAMPIDQAGSNGAKVVMQDGRLVVSAVELVLDALAHMTPGAIFVPEIPSHHVRDLACTLGESRWFVQDPFKWWQRWAPRFVLRVLRRFGVQIEPTTRTHVQHCEIIEVGLREGERLHEVLISPSEACRTWRRPEGGWVILRSADETWPGGTRVPEGFRFSSDQYPLSIEWKEKAA
jgi:UDP-N-acetylglucosamine 4,6-dehydratase/5-epimerase